MSVLPCSQAFEKQLKNAFDASWDYGAGAADGAGAVLQEVVVVLGGEDTAADYLDVFAVAFFQLGDELGEEGFVAGGQTGDKVAHGF